MRDSNARAQMGAATVGAGSEASNTRHSLVTVLDHARSDA